ncbi:MAG TPA: hypothetical protein VGW35_04490 [Methylomirabilota bacterium]|nr:hypothetical protein [Methylomirabilota bacterium]
MRHHTIRLLTLALVVALVGSAPAGADVLHLRNGGRIEVRAWRDAGDAVEFERFGGVVRIPREDIERIERDPRTPGAPGGMGAPPSGGPVPIGSTASITEPEVRVFMTEEDGAASIGEWKRRTRLLDKVADTARMTITSGGRQITLSGAEYKRWAWAGYRDDAQITIRTTVEAVSIHGDTAEVTYAVETTVVDRVTRRPATVTESGTLTLQKRGGRLMETARQASLQPAR